MEEVRTQIYETQKCWTKEIRQMHTCTRYSKTTADFKKKKARHEYRELSFSWGKKSSIAGDNTSDSS